MAKCMIYETIGKGQHKKELYKIWSIRKRESILSYWYVVMLNSTYRQLLNVQADKLDEAMDALTAKGIDIRTLPNYKDFSALDIPFNQQKLIVPLIKEAVRKGYIEPI